MRPTVRLSPRHRGILTLPIVWGALLLIQRPAEAERTDQAVTATTLSYHRIRVALPGNTILPWFSADLGDSYDQVLNLTWNFWFTMRADKNGLPYYMNHQVWKPNFNDRRGVGGDQFAQALSSFALYYRYSGKEEVKEEMKFIADTYLTRSLSPADAAWPNIPYPYNTLLYSGRYDGDMILGVAYTQPDKAGSFGFELLKLYEMTGNRRYLESAIAIADTLAGHVQAGDQDHSPLPFRVNALTGEVGKLRDNAIDQFDTSLFEGRAVVGEASYTTAFGPTLELFLELKRLGAGKASAYEHATGVLLDWMKAFPLRTNRWGPFHEDIPGWSDTQINAVTFAQFIMDHRELFPNWQREARGILDWVYGKLGNLDWQAYGVIVVNEQTAYQVPGNSHTARQASAELQYARLSGDLRMKDNAVRELSWATYMVDGDGKNCYPRDEVWMCDGYGDYMRHYVRAMGDEPSLAPLGHMVSSTSTIMHMEYPGQINKFLMQVVPADQVDRTMINYVTFDPSSVELIKLAHKPQEVWVGPRLLRETNAPEAEGWSWNPVTHLLRIDHRDGKAVKVLSDAR